jgi:hypothetical protein
MTTFQRAEGGRNGFSEIGGKSRSAGNLERMTNASNYA